MAQQRAHDRAPRRLRSPAKRGVTKSSNGPMDSTACSPRWSPGSADPAVGVAALQPSVGPREYPEVDESEEGADSVRRLGRGDGPIHQLAEHRLVDLVEAADVDAPLAEFVGAEPCEELVRLLLGPVGSLQPV